MLLWLTNAKHFTELHVLSDYWYIILDNESRYLTTFQTGLGWYLHLARDITVFGSGDEIEQVSADHDLNLKLLLQLNKEKVQHKELDSWVAL